MAVFNDVVEAHKVVEDAVLDAFSNKGMEIERRPSDVETKFGADVASVVVGTWDDGYRVYVKDGNQRSFGEPVAQGIASVDEVIVIIRENSAL